MAVVQMRFTDGSEGAYSCTSEYHPFMLYCGTAHDRALRLAIADAARHAGFTVKDVDGPFGTVIVEVRRDSDDHKKLDAVEGVTSYCVSDYCGCLMQDQCPLGIHS